MSDNDYQYQQAFVNLAAADSTKTLIAAPGAGETILIKAIHWNVITAAAQTVTVGKTGGAATELAIRFPASMAIGVGSRVFQRPFKMPTNIAVIALPASAGPAIDFIIEYYTTSIIG